MTKTQSHTPTRDKPVSAAMHENPALVAALRDTLHMLEICYQAADARHAILPAGVEDQITLARTALAAVDGKA
jgi:hypothetical protein